MIVISAMILTLLGMMPCRSCHVWPLLKPHQSRYFVYDGMPIISNVLFHCHERLKNFSVCINFEITTLTWLMIMIDQSLHRVLFLFGYWGKPSRGQILRQVPQTGGSSPNQSSSFMSAWKSDRQHRWHFPLHCIEVLSACQHWWFGYLGCDSVVHCLAHLRYKIFFTLIRLIHLQNFETHYLVFNLVSICWPWWQCLTWLTMPRI